MNTRATKNMWVVRCSHIGAMVGGLLSIAFGSLRKTALFLISNIIEIIFALLFAWFILYFIFDLYSDYKEDKIATPDSVKEVIASPNYGFCVKNYIPVYAESKIKKDPGYILKIGDLNKMVKECKKAIKAEENKKVLEEQLKAAK